jgi:two-component system, cell cycle response regulator DivK
MASILIVEDHPANLKLARLILESAGYAVIAAENAADGLALARKEAPALILMDIQLPGMDGLAATRELKGDPATAPIPVIALTAFAMHGDAVKIRAAGCDGYVAKPFRRASLLDAVARLLPSDQKAVASD